MLARPLLTFPRTRERGTRSDGATSHSIKPSKNAEQVAGYRYAISTLLAPHHGRNVATADDVDMQMKYFLSTAFAGVDHGAKTMVQPLLFRQPGRRQPNI